MRKSGMQNGTNHNLYNYDPVQNAIESSTRAATMPKGHHEFDIEAYDSSLGSANIKLAQREMFGRHSNSTIGCVNCIGKSLAVVNGQTQMHNSVRLLAYNKNQENEFNTPRFNHSHNRMDTTTRQWNEMEEYGKRLKGPYNHQNYPDPEKSHNQNRNFNGYKSNVEMRKSRR